MSRRLRPTAIDPAFPAYVTCSLYTPKQAAELHESASPSPYRNGDKPSPTILVLKFSKFRFNQTFYNRLSVFPARTKSVRVGILSGCRNRLENGFF